MDNQEKIDSLIEEVAGHSDDENYEEILECCDKIIELDPDFVEVYLNRGYAYMELERYEEALSDYDKAIELDPENTGAKDNKKLASEKLEKQLIWKTLIKEAKKK